jgi:hypothetical protein
MKESEERVNNTIKLVVNKDIEDRKKKCKNVFEMIEFEDE